MLRLHHRPSPHLSSHAATPVPGRAPQVNRRLVPRAVHTEDAVGTQLSLVLSENPHFFREVPIPSAALLEAAPTDFFSLLGLEYYADEEDVKKAYRALQRIIHPDIAGEAANDMAVILNAAYETLRDKDVRRRYAAEVKKYRAGDAFFDNRPVSRWMGSAGEERAVFVDESMCIGCQNCTHCAPDTFLMEDDYGRARVHTQWGSSLDDIQEAVSMCPVDCISYVKRQQLALLEYVMKSCKREDIAIMMRRRSGNLGSAPARENPFVRAEVWLRQRKEAKLDAVEGELSKRTQDEALAASIAAAWLALPRAARLQGWPAWQESPLSTLPSRPAPPSAPPSPLLAF